LKQTTLSGSTLGGSPSVALFHSCKGGVEFTLQRGVNHGANRAALRVTNESWDRALVFFEELAEASPAVTCNLRGTDHRIIGCPVASVTVGLRGCSGGLAREGSLASGMARDRGEAVRGCWPTVTVGAAAEENQAVPGDDSPTRTSVRRGRAREEHWQNGGAGGVEGRQILEEQSILEVSDHVQICCGNLAA
jgi:hypothetical protein